jgi:biotin-dependent carboxylase-like uncharacterized protein
MSGRLNVISPGLSTTVQDAGRIGFQRQGVPVSGALDRLALAAANVVVGNRPTTAALEMLYQGAEFGVEDGAVRVAVAGGGARLEIRSSDTEPMRIEGSVSMRVAAGARLRVVIPGPGIVSYLAIEGGVDVPEVMGSRSTYVRAGIGGLKGRALQAGDRLAIAGAAAAERAEQRLAVELAPPTRVRIVPGPQDDYFSATALATLTATAYRVAPASDRMGLRLAGATLEHTRGYNIVSDGIAPGAIQVPGDGLPIVLMADRQTTGGYPKIATVASADMAALGRLGPGAEIRFVAVTLDEAEAARRAFEAQIAGLAGRLTAIGGAIAIDPARLAALNLVSGVRDAYE